MSKEEIKNPWTTLSGEEKYDNRWIKVTEYQVLNPSGGKGIYGKVHFKNQAIGIVPIDAELHTFLVGQYRFPLDGYSWDSSAKDTLSVSTRNLPNVATFTWFVGGTRVAAKRVRIR